MSKWRLTSIYIDGEKQFAVVRNYRDNEPDHSGNREYATGYMKDKKKAEKIVEELNSKNDYSFRD